MPEDIVSKFWRKWYKSVDKSKHIKPILDAIDECSIVPQKNICILSMMLNSYLEDLYDFAYTEGFEDGKAFQKLEKTKNKARKVD